MVPLECSISSLLLENELKLLVPYVSESVAFSKPLTGGITFPDADALDAPICITGTYTQANIPYLPLMPFVKDGFRRMIFEPAM